jgi:excisionase family DNA binding protein
MKTGPTRFGARENTAFPNQHAPRFSTRTPPNIIGVHESPPEDYLTSYRSDVQAAAPSIHDTIVARTSQSLTGIDECPMTVREAARFLGVSAQTVYLWVERKQIPHLRVMGRNIRFLKSDLDSFRASFKQEMENE